MTRPTLRRAPLALALLCALSAATLAACDRGVRAPAAEAPAPAAAPTPAAPTAGIDLAGIDKSV